MGVLTVKHQLNYSVLASRYYSIDMNIVQYCSFLNIQAVVITLSRGWGLALTP